MQCYKLFRIRKDGSLGPLFINRRLRIPVGVWLPAEDHPTKGYAQRPGWHCVAEQKAPHLKKKEDRVWCKVSVRDYTEFSRPDSQGGLWYLANQLKVEEIIG